MLGVEENYEGYFHVIKIGTNVTPRIKLTKQIDIDILGEEKNY